EPETSQAIHVSDANRDRLALNCRLGARAPGANWGAAPVGRATHAIEGLSPEVANYYSVFWVTPRSLQAWLDEGKGTSESLAQAGAVHSFGALPLIVLSREIGRASCRERV